MYTINEIANIAGTTKRTLRYYDSISLLKPSFVNNSNYRIYTDKEVDQLQVILFYKTLGFSLKEIKEVLKEGGKDLLFHLKKQKKALEKEKKRIELLCKTIDKTIAKEKGETTMTNDDKFEGLKEKMIEDNELLYGKEIRKEYGDTVIEDSYQRFRSLSPYQMKEADELAKTILTTLSQLLLENKPESIEAQELCTLHEKWIKYYWSTYSKSAHLGLVKMYTQDDRFTAYYDKAGVGATDYLYKAMKIYLK